MEFKGKYVEKIINSKDLQVKYKMLVNLPKVSVDGIILRELESNLFLRSVHKNCHKTIDRELIGKEKQWRFNVKKHLDRLLFKAINEFRDSIKMEIKKYKKLTKSQIEEISYKRNLYKNNN